MLSILVVCYLFLGGAGAGACAVLFTLGLLTPKSLLRQSKKGSFLPPIPYRQFYAPTFIVAFLALLIGAVCLVADLGRIDRVLNLFTNPSFSMISVGSFMIVLLLMFALFAAIMWSGGVKRLPLSFVIIIEIVGLIISLVVIAYTGLLLQSISAVSFWATPLVPILFILSSLSTGMAIVVGTSCFSGAVNRFCGVLEKIIRVDLLIIALEIIGLILLMAFSVSSPEKASSALLLLTGDMAFVFWIALVLGGLILPGVLELFALQKTTIALFLIIAVLVLVGGFALRYCVVEAAAYTSIPFLGGFGG